MIIMEKVLQILDLVLKYAHNVSDMSVTDATSLLPVNARRKYWTESLCSKYKSAAKYKQLERITGRYIRHIGSLL